MTVTGAVVSRAYEAFFQPAPGVRFLKARRILIVEDDVVLSRILTAVLEKQGFIVEVAPDGQKALEMMWKNRQPSLVLLDLTLPYHDGFEILSRMRQNSLWREVPIIVLTAMKDAKDAVRALNGGANDFITKPVHFHELVERIDIFSY